MKIIEETKEKDIRICPICDEEYYTEADEQIEADY